MSQQAQVDAINAALSAAKLAAANATPVAAGGVPAVQTVGSPSAPALGQGGAPVSMRTMVAEAGMRPDAYLKVTPAGFNVGKDTKTFFDEIAVEFRLDNAKPFYGLRFGNPAKYLRSYDRQVETKSRKLWATCVAEATQLDPRCTGDYPAVDLLMTVTEAINAKGGDLLLDVGKTLGWTSSVTNWGGWAAFIEPIYTLIDLGIIRPDAMIRGKIKHDQRSGNGNTWGLVTFDDLSVADLGAPEELAAAA